MLLPLHTTTIKTLTRVPNAVRIKSKVLTTHDLPATAWLHLSRLITIICFTLLPRSLCSTHTGLQALG